MADACGDVPHWPKAPVRSPPPRKSNKPSATKILPVTVPRPFCAGPFCTPKRPLAVRVPCGRLPTSIASPPAPPGTLANRCPHRRLRRARRRRHIALRPVVVHPHGGAPSPSHRFTIQIIAYLATYSLLPMPTFRYQALDSAQSLVTGELTADSVADAVAQLQASVSAVQSIGLVSRRPSDEASSTTATSSPDQQAVQVACRPTWPVFSSRENSSPRHSLPTPEEMPKGRRRRQFRRHQRAQPRRRS